ncbi:MAG: DNA cytosine methyltransferase [Thermosynechococcaceae cyanobacterium]
MSDKRPIAIDLFAGAGGLSLGFEQAGFDVVAAVEVDPIHAAIHTYNFSSCAVLAQSVVGLTGEAIRAAAQIGQQPIDVVFGGAPCQGFSLMGQRALDDPRNALVREFVRLVQELDAAYFVFENVKGLTVGQHRLFLEELIAAFEALDYRVQLPWQVLNAAFYGVPQNRDRLILMGARQGLPLPQYPVPQTKPAGSAKFAPLALPDSPSCQDALSDLPEAEGFAELLDRDWVRIPQWAEPQNPYAREMRILTPEAWHWGYPRRWKASLLTASIRTRHSALSRRRFAETVPGQVEPISRFFKLTANGVANTLRAGTDSARGAFTSPRPIHYNSPRCITVREMARLHGFPDWFRLHPTKWHGARQIGNAVPPPLARCVATQILAAMDRLPTRPNGIQLLGDPALLDMDMTEAAQYWGIAIPIRRRDRKSGAKKNNQQSWKTLPSTGAQLNHGCPLPRSTN